jgi:hypothetical protein
MRLDRRFFDMEFLADFAIALTCDYCPDVWSRRD